MVTTSFPAAMRAEACVCRNEWNVASGTARPHMTENELGEIGVPSEIAEHQGVVLVLAQAELKPKL